ncbi:MAG: hypothetical protein QXR84_07115 [Candidatus Bathyarchaeia archaeon]
MGKIEEEMRYIVRNYVESEKKLCQRGNVEGSIEVETELGKADYVCIHPYRSGFCVNIFEIKTPPEIKSMSDIKRAIKELLVYSAAIRFHENYKHCKYYRCYLVVDVSSFKKGVIKKKDLNDIVKRYQLGLLITDLRIKRVEEKIRPKPGSYKSVDCY